MESTKLKTLLLIIFTIFCNASGQELRFTNPILDPSELSYPYGFAFKLGSHYYLLGAQDEVGGGIINVAIWKSPILTDFHNATQKIIKLPRSSIPVQMHLINGELYIYVYTFLRTSVFVMSAIKAKDSSDPMGDWEDAVVVAPDVSYATVMKHRGKNYLISAIHQLPYFEYDIFITEMITPTTISNETVLLKHPTEDYECYRNEEDYNVCANIYPALLYRNNITYLILTAKNGRDEANNQLIQMSISTDKDPLNPANWNHHGVVFASDEGEGVIGSGGYGTSFVESPDMSETWMVYTAMDDVSGPDKKWTPRLEKIDWNADGTPKYPKAHGRNNPQPIPSGQTFIS